ncbi:MAG: serine--tRNA ligase [Cyanobacteria bacterium MAG CAR1_bin_15]|nr:serine--tRNA ligase [Cyanobacteria bacterium MAG CAR1_bin_15]
MLDPRLVRQDPAHVAAQLTRRGLVVDIDALHHHARQVQKLADDRANLQAEGKKVSRLVGGVLSQIFEIRENLPSESEYGPGGGYIITTISGQQGEKLDDLKDLASSLEERGKAIKKEVAALEEQEKTLQDQLRDELLHLPNLPSPHCPDGRGEADNVELRRWGDPKPAAPGLEHWQLAKTLGLFESERSVRIAQSRFITLLGLGARLERALIQFMLDLHVGRGYVEVLPPALVNTASLTGSGQLPKFAEESFRCAEDDLWLSPTAEVPLTNLHRDEILPASDLPRRYVAYSPCFRREAGSYGRDTRGLIRLHQFNKVELYWFCHPDGSAAAHEQLTADAEAVLQALDLPYRVVELCTADLGFSASRTYDLEVWLAGAGVYREVSSCSTCGDFQARRAAIRMKDGKRNRLLHTLNGSGLAVGRTMAALLEWHQQPDGSVAIPQALQPYMGCTVITPPSAPE